MRENKKFACVFNPKIVVQPSRENISISFFQKMWFSVAIPPHRRGALRDRHDTRGGEAVAVMASGALAQTTGDVADGEVVWS